MTAADLHSLANFLNDDADGDAAKHAEASELQEVEADLQSILAAVASPKACIPARGPPTLSSIVIVEVSLQKRWSKWLHLMEGHRSKIEGMWQSLLHACS